jgi:hypothetical protein
MSPLFNKYKSVVGNTHGWGAELTCAQCAFNGLPRYEGWSPNLTVNISGRPTIYAKLACAKCGRRLTDEAGKKLVELFKDVAIPKQNVNIIKEFIAELIIVPFAFAALLFVGVQFGWWGYSAFAILAVSAAFIQPLVMRMNYRIALLRSRCDCGHSNYLFMGLLGRTYCYRCSSCGRKLRLRD